MAVEGIGLPFPEAIAYFRRKVDLPAARWDDLRHGAHARAFSVAGVTQAEMLADFRNAIDKAVAKGTGLAEFKQTFDQIVDRTGWQFYARGKTDAERRAWRARLIYRTNMRTAYMAGRYAQMTDPDVLRYRPYWRYRHHDSRHPRLHHLAWDGLCLRADDPWWKVHFPPNGWGCNCDVEAISERQLKGLKKDGLDKAPADAAVRAIDPRTGQEELRYPGIDRSWEYNVGEASLRGVVPPELQEPLPPFVPAAPPSVDGSPQVAPPRRPANLPPLPEPTPVDAARILPKGLPERDYAEAFLKEFGADLSTPVEWRDPSGGIIGISADLFAVRAAPGEVIGAKADKAGRGPYMKLLADAIKDPDEIWVDWAAVTSGSTLKRTYLKWILAPKNVRMLVRFEWTPRGWTGITAFDANGAYIERLRQGALLYRRG